MICRHREALLPSFKSLMINFATRYVAGEERNFQLAADNTIHPKVCLFYLVLRGLDTIEDDMTLPLDCKVELLRSFDKIIYQKGWTFNESK